MFPRLTIYKVATPGWRMGWNRYPDGIYGTAVVLGSRSVSIRWRRR